MQEFYDQRTLISDHWFPFREPVPYIPVVNHIQLYKVCLVRAVTLYRGALYWHLLSSCLKPMS